MERMSAWRKWMLRLGALALVGVAAFAGVISYDAPCGAPPPAGTGDTMQAVMYRCYGPPEVLALETVARPQPGPDQVQVRVHAASLNPLDHHYMRGRPYVIRLSAGIGRPSSAAMGTDFAGTVTAVGAKVTRFKPGDAVFGAADGAFGEYLVRSAEGAIAAIPAGLSFEQAAAMPVAAVTALQALRDHARVRAGQKVLINGASGGVGTFAVQIAKSMGAQVTGVCSTRNVDLVRSLGADQVIDYTQQDFTSGTEHYDVIIDMVGNHPISRLVAVMPENGVYVKVGAVEKSDWLQPFDTLAAVSWASLWHPQRFETLFASLPAADLEALASMASAGQLVSAIDRRFALTETVEAMRYLETGRARGKVIIEVMDPAQAAQ